MPQESENIYNLHPIRQGGISVEVTDRILDLITKGQIKPGDRLPAERELAAMLGVGRTTLRESLRHLTMTGLLESKRGSGTYVSRQVKNRIVEQAGWSLYLSSAEAEDVFEIRRSLECLAASLAAQRSTLDEKQRMAIYRELKEIEGRDIPREVAIGMAFHESITQASHNPLLIHFMSSIRNLLGRFIQGTAEVRHDKESTYAEHEAIYMAILIGDAPAAARAMEIHLGVSYGLLAEQTAAGDGKL